MLKAGVIGCGMIAGAYEELEGREIYSHGKAYRRDGAFGELGFVDAHAERAQLLAARFSGKAYADAASMLSQLSPDVVSVCVPDDKHFEVLKLVLESSKPPRVVFAEKPVCANETELAALMKLEKASGSLVVVNHTRRFDPAHRRVRELIESGKLGALVSGHVDYYGGFRHLGVHLLDLLVFFFGVEPEAEELRYRCASKYEDDPTLDGVLRVREAALTLTGNPEANYQIFDVGLLFEKGQVKLTDFGKRVEVLFKTVNAAKESVLETDLSLSGQGLDNPIAHAVRAIAEYLKSGERAALADYGLAEAEKTMHALWRGSNSYADRA